MINLKLLMVIIDEGHDKKINNLFNRLGIKVKTVSTANGTASPSMLDYFGLVESKKNLFMAIIADTLMEKILLKLKQTFKLEKEGTGIAFVIPISSSNKFLVDAFHRGSLDRRKNEMKEGMKIKYHLIVTIASDGFSEKIISAVKKTGGFGGTVLRGRELSNIIPQKILGFNIECEREIVLNVVPENERKKVMEEITKATGIKTDAKGLCFSLPIEDAIGLDLFEE